MTEPKATTPAAAGAAVEASSRRPDPSSRDVIRRARSINRAALEAVHALLQASIPSLECPGVPAWPARLGVALAEECLSLELIYRCLDQQGAALEHPAFPGLAESVQALERTVLTLREVGRKKLMLASLAVSAAGGSEISLGAEEDLRPLRALSDAVRREALGLARKLGQQQDLLDRAIETRAALVQQVFLG